MRIEPYVIMYEGRYIARDHREEFSCHRFYMALEWLAYISSYLCASSF
mgnify:CR=1 FL=1